ncbi:MAG: hypothetical protein A6D91_05345 [Bacillaceae bacterium G1]|nr:copper resistance protein CopZ [Bacillota bacterium]OJF16778.1 MAG: hypothetical protein A6D91_05345 [Bacillaceae bacterium G1]
MGEQLVLKVEGMTCNHCKAAVENAVRQLSGVLAAEVDLGRKTVTVQYEPDRVSVEQMKQAIEEEGYDVVDVS